MTLVQCFALFGVFTIGAILGGWIGFVYLKWCMRHMIVETVYVGACTNPECSERHLQLRLRHALGTHDFTFQLSSEALRSGDSNP